MIISNVLAVFADLMHCLSTSSNDSNRDGGESSVVVATTGALSETVATVSLRTVPRLFICRVAT